MKVFVYGTLKRGYGNHGYLRSSKFEGNAYSKDCYTLYNCGFPLAYRKPDGYPIAGEIYEVPETVLTQDLDRLEGNGHFYTRHEREFIMEGETVTAWVYEIPSLAFYAGAVCGLNENEHYEWKR
jgi:gamma-glutamylaminecyclotransferase